MKLEWILLEKHFKSLIPMVPEELQSLILKEIILAFQKMPVLKNF